MQGSERADLGSETVTLCQRGDNDPRRSQPSRPAGSTRRGLEPHASSCRRCSWQQRAGPHAFVAADVPTTLPANELARYALYMYDHVQPSVDLGYPGRRLELIRLFDREGDEARAYDGLRGWPVLRESVGR